LLILRSFTPNQINIFFHLTFEFNKGGKHTEEFPVQHSRLVLIHNHIMEALTKPDTNINEDYDFWSSVSRLKDHTAAPWSSRWLVALTKQLDFSGKNIALNGCSGWHWLLDFYLRR